MPLFNDTITIGVQAELTQFERQVAEGAARAARSIKPIELRFNTGGSQPLGKITGDISQFNKSIDAAAARVLAFTSTVAIVNGVVQTFRSLVKETVAVEKALTDINVVLQTNAKGLNDVRDSLFRIAKDTGQSFKVVTEAAVEFSRQGLGIEKTLRATNAALLLSRLSGLDAAEAVKTLTASINGFNKEALTYESVVNKLANVDANFAVSTKDLAEALTRVGSTASEAKVSFNELVAAVTAVQQTTSRGGAVIGNAFKTIFTRLGREDTVKQLRELGVQIDETASGIDKLKSIAAAIRDVDATTANTIKELAGGVFQINVVSAALGDLGKGYSIYSSALEAANQETASAVIRNEALNKTLDALSKKAGTNIQDLLSKFGQLSIGDRFKDFLSTFNSSLELLGTAVDGEGIGSEIAQDLVKGVGNVLTGPVAIAAVGTFFRLVTKVGSDAFNAFKQFSGIATQSEKISVIQDSINQKVAKNAELYLAQLGTGKSIVDVQRSILRNLDIEYAKRSTLAKVANVDPTLLVKSANQYNLVKGEQGASLVRKAAGGFLPAMVQEQRSILAGVGGASPSARPVLIPSFNYGDRTGPIVVNSSEKIVDNWMGGRGSAVLNPTMISALGGASNLSSFGSVRSVAEGFVPSLASFSVAGGTVNLKKRGANILLDEILAGFGPDGNRLQGTGIVKKAFDLAVVEGKKTGAENILVDILNSKVADSLNSNPKFSAFGPFSRGKYKIPLRGFADGFVPSLASLFDVKGVLGIGARGTAYSVAGAKGLPDLVFKRFHTGDRSKGFRLSNNEAIGAEFDQFKMLESLGFNVAKVFGSKERAIARGGIVKEKAKGFLARTLAREIGSDPLVQLKEDVKQSFAKKGILANDTHSGNFNIDDNYDELVKTFKEKGYEAFRDRAISRAQFFDGDFQRGAASGYIPFFNSPLRDAVKREMSGLLDRGYPEGAVRQGIRVGHSPNLISEKNPDGLGVYNVLQGQTSLQRAFADHGGQNLKNVGAAGGYIPSLAPGDAFGNTDLSKATGGTVSKIVTQEINDIIKKISQERLGSKGSNKALYDIEVAKRQLNAVSQDLVNDAIRAAVVQSQKAALEFKGGLNKATGGGAINKAKKDEVNELIRSAANTKSPLELQGLREKLGSLEGDLAKASFEKVKKNFEEAAKIGSKGRAATERSFAKLSEEASKSIAQRGFLSPTTGRGIFDNLQGVDRLPPLEQERLRRSISQEAGADRAQKFRNASLGLSIGASFVTPIVDSGAAAAKAAGNTTLGQGLEAGSSALTGFSLGAQFGPQGAIIGTAIGAIYGLADALDDTDEQAQKLAKSFEEVASQNSALVNGLSSYVDVQQRLTSVIETGGKERDIEALRRELSNTFATIADPEARRGILAAGADIDKLYKVLNEASRKGTRDTNVAGVLAATAGERDRLTFLGAVPNSNFSQKSIGAISTSLSQNIDPKNLAGVADEVKRVSDNLSKGGFVELLQRFGYDGDQAAKVFEDLIDSTNRLRLLGTLKKDLDFREELRKSEEQATKFRTSLVDLNKVLSTIVNIQTSNKRTQLGLDANAFGVQQNAAQGAAGNQFFNASEFAKGQLATAFDIRQTQFAGQQQRSGTLNDLQGSVAEFITQNRQALERDKELSAALTRFADTGQGDIESLLNRAVTNAVGKGDESKVFSDLAGILTESRNKLISIDDNTNSQVRIAQQNLATLRQRVAIENRVNLLGGAEGQINFRNQGLERFRDRGINDQIAGLGGRLGTAGRAEGALGILELQKSFGNLEGFDARSIIPNAQELVKNAIQESLIEGLGRAKIDITPERLTEIGKVSELSAQKEFARKELTSDEIGKAVGAQFNYEKLVAGNQLGFGNALKTSGMPASTAFVPQIYSFLKARFSLESERANVAGQLQKNISSQSEEKTRIDNATKEIRTIQAKSGTIEAPGKLPNIFSSGIIKGIAEDIAADANRARLTAGGAGAGAIGPVSSPATADADGTAKRIAEYIRLRVLESGNGPISFDKFIKNVNDALNPSFLNKTFNADVGITQKALLTQLSDVGGLSPDNKVNQTGREFLAGQFDSIGVLSIKGEEAGKKVGELGQVIAESTTKIGSMVSQADAFKIALAKLETAIESVRASAEGKPPLLLQKPSSAGFAQSLADRARLGGGTFSAFAASQTAPLFPSAGVQASAAEAAAAQKRNEEAEQIRLRFGNVDTSKFQAFFRSQEANAAAPNRANARSENQSRAALLRDAQLQAFNNGGRVSPDFGNLAAQGFKGISQQLSGANAQEAFERLVDDANDAFVSGFATEGDLKKIGVRISQSLEDYVRTQIKLGVPPGEAERKGKELRDKIQKQLDGLQIKLPKNKIEEFGQGFSSRLEELQKSFDDLSALGAQTADSLTNGFGDAFFEIASGAKSAEDAVRGMLSSVAADLSKFFAKRAFAQIFASVAGNASASSFGGFGTGKANGGIIKRASGGYVPAMVMGGEHVFGPETVNSFGVDFFKDLNAGKVAKYESGGRIQGGSGSKDDVFGMFQEGSFVLQKSAVNKYGPNFLSQIEDAGQYSKGGKVKRAFWGALLGAIASKAIQGAVVGGVTAKITGGDWKKGALYGGIAGGIAGGVGGYSSALKSTGTFGSQFGNAFSGGITNVGFGDKEKTFSYSSGVSGQTNGVPLALSPNGPSFGSTNGPASLGTISSANGGFATGLGNQSLTTAQTQPSIYKTAGTNLLAGLALAGLSSALAPKQADSGGSKIVPGNGSITTYNSDGSVNISGVGGVKTIRPTDYTSPAQLAGLVAANGGNLPQGGLPGLAAGGEVASGSGSVSYKDRSVLSQLNKASFANFAMGGPVQKPVGLFAMGGLADDEEFSKALSPYITTGSGTKDDVNAKLTKGEFVMSKEATDFYGPELLRRFNNLEIPQRATGGVLSFESGGMVERNPSDRDMGLFSLSGTNTNTPVVAGPSARGAVGGGPISIQMTVNVNGNGATVETSSTGETNGVGKSAIDSDKFATKVKMLFSELVEQEKRPGGSLSPDNMR